MTPEPSLVHVRCLRYLCKYRLNAVPEKRLRDTRSNLALRRTQAQLARVCAFEHEGGDRSYGHVSRRSLDVRLLHATASARTLFDFQSASRALFFPVTGVVRM
eukprot:3088113-Prymnesium_polylepis.1